MGNVDNSIYNAPYSGAKLNNACCSFTHKVAERWMCTMGDGQSFIEGIAQLLLAWFQSRLIAGIIDFQEERLLPSWGPEDMKQGQKAGDNSPPATSCQGAGEENQRHEEKGTAETSFQVPSWSHKRPWGAVCFICMSMIRYLYLKNSKQKIPNSPHWGRSTQEDKKTQFSTDIHIQWWSHLERTKNKLPRMDVFFLHTLPLSSLLNIPC